MIQPQDNRSAIRPPFRDAARPPAFVLAVLIGCVIVGSLAPATSTVMVDIGRLQINDKVMHFCATWRFRFCLWSDSGTGAGAHGRSVDVSSWRPHGGRAAFLPRPLRGAWDVIANGAGVSCGALLGRPVRA